jgi:hypothetical protein
MKTEEARRLVEKNCFHGRSMPRSLATLWSSVEGGDDTLARTFRIELLSDLGALDAGYGDAIASESADIAANVRAHREVFAHLGFFAALEDDEFLAYWLVDPSAEPPVVKLDNEGQYSWKGRNLAEALFRLAEQRDPDGARRWLSARGLELGEVGELGASTQFLPDLSQLQQSKYCAAVGRPGLVARKPSEAPATPDDPMTWLLRPGPEVQEVMTRLLGTPPLHYCVWCGGDGLVESVALSAKTKSGPILGIELGASKADVQRALGDPERTGRNWIRFQRDQRLFRFGLDAQDRVTSITLMIAESS